MPVNKSRLILVYLIVLGTFMLACYIGFTGYPIVLILYGGIGICFSAYGWFKETHNKSWFLRSALYATTENAEDNTENKTSNNERQSIVAELFEDRNPEKSNHNANNKSDHAEDGNCAKQ